MDEWWIDVNETWMIIEWQMHIVVLLATWDRFVYSNDDGKNN
jgi:hypothetical protein